MYSYSVKPERKPAYISGTACFSMGILLMLTGCFGQEKYTLIPQILALAFLITAILITNRYLLTNYLYEIEEEKNSLSALPKLNIYASRSHNFGHQFYCLPMDQLYEIEAAPGKEKRKFHTINACGSMFPREVYLIQYNCEGARQGIYLECSADFAAAIKRYITLYGKKEAVE